MTIKKFKKRNSFVFFKKTLHFGCGCVYVHLVHTSLKIIHFLLKKKIKFPTGFSIIKCSHIRVKIFNFRFFKKLMRKN